MTRGGRMGVRAILLLSCRDQKGLVVTRVAILVSRLGHCLFRLTPPGSRTAPTPAEAGAEAAHVHETR